MRTARHAFTLIELMVVIAIIVVIIGIALPVIARVRQYGLRSQCMANLHSIGGSFHAYASENRGYIPRYAIYDDPTGPIWLVAVAKYMGLNKDFNWPALRRIKALQCPSHPLEDIPSGYVLNCFALDSEPNWLGSQPVQLGSIKNPANVVLVTDASDKFGPGTYGPYDGIMFEPHHIVLKPDHLPGGAKPRITDRRHVGGASNVLFVDGHVAVLKIGEMKLELFDDGIRGRVWKPY